MLKAVLLAVDEVNARGGAGGYKVEAVVYDSATSTTGQEDPTQAVDNYQKFISNPSIVAAIGPAFSSSGKAISPILSVADMATITPSSTNPEITDPKFRVLYSPMGKSVYFRTLTTEVYQGSDMATFAYRSLNVRKVYILDDGGAFGVGISDAFQRRAKELGMVVLGRDQLNPTEPDYRTLLIKINGLNPEAIYYGGTMQAGVKLAQQVYMIMPRVHKFGSSGLHVSTFVEHVGKDAADGWFVANSAPDVLSDPKAVSWVSTFNARFDRNPTNYSVTAYDAVLVIADAVSRLVKDGRPVTRSNVRDYIQTTNLRATLQGPLSFDQNGDLRTRAISLYQVSIRRFEFIGTADTAGPPEYTVVRVFYGTDRARVGGSQSPSSYGADRAQVVQLGFCDVSIPREHRMGKLEAPSIWRLEFRKDPNRHVVLLKVSPQNAQEFKELVRVRIDASARKEAFVFIHGYNVSFEDAARRTAQISYDLGFDGVPIFFSWPSQDNSAAYTVDETMVDWAIPDLADFLRMVSKDLGARTVHLIAHSMGNRAMTEALRRLGSDSRSAVAAAFREILLTAPDIDADKFKRDIVPQIQSPGRRLTLYASAKDEALLASKVVHKDRRAGDAKGDIVISGGLDTIDATAVDTGLVGHSYYADNRSVMSDMFYLLRDGKPPDQRFGLISRSSPGGRYWEFRP